MDKAKRLLVVEDDPDIMMAVTQAMEIEGFEVAAALDISVAEALIKDRMPDIAVIDHGLPDGTGNEFCKKIRAASDLPVIMYTAEAYEHTVKGCIEAGATDYVLKDTGIEELVSRVRKHTTAA